MNHLEIVLHGFDEFHISNKLPIVIH